MTDSTPTEMTPRIERTADLMATAVVIVDEELVAPMEKLGKTVLRMPDGTPYIEQQIGLRALQAADPTIFQIKPGEYSISTPQEQSNGNT